MLTERWGDTHVLRGKCNLKSIGSKEPRFEDTETYDETNIVCIPFHSQQKKNREQITAKYSRKKHPCDRRNLFNLISADLLQFFNLYVTHSQFRYGTDRVPGGSVPMRRVSCPLIKSYRKYGFTVGIQREESENKEHTNNTVHTESVGTVKRPQKNQNIAEINTFKCVCCCCCFFFLFSSRIFVVSGFIIIIFGYAPIFW